MALMFQRIARNFVKDGYFPTDAETTRRTLNALVPAEGGDRLRIIDPCCGEGVALAECKHHLGADRTEAFGIEYDEERAWHAKQLLDHCIHGDLQDCVIGKRQYGHLWLNPPYGGLISDQSGAAAKWQGRKRLEKLFYALTNGLLQFGGVLVFILPYTSLDRELSGWIARHFERVQLFLAPEQRFKQVVILGVRRRVAEAFDTASVRDRLAAAGSGDLPLEFPETWDQAPYVVPALRKREATFVQTRLDTRQLTEVIDRHPCLWSQFQSQFGTVAFKHRRPLCALSQWHLGLSLAAGQVAGVVRSTDGRVFVIKGDTHKAKDIKTERMADGDGCVTETRIHTDVFVPVIRALDFTPDSPTFGETIEIR